MQIEDYLHQKDFYQLLKGKKLVDMKNEDQDLLDFKALNKIMLTLSQSFTFNVKNQITTPFIEVLSDLYEQLFAINKYIL